MFGKKSELTTKKIVKKAIAMIITLQVGRELNKWADR